MNNNFSNNVNQPTQQQYLNIQSFETQGQQIQKNNYFEQQDKLNDLSIRTNFLKKVFAILLIEFFITYVMFMLVVFTYLFDLFYLIAYICVSDYEDGQKVETCGYYYGPTWVFYFSKFFDDFVIYTLLWTTKWKINYASILVFLILIDLWIYVCNNMGDYGYSYQFYGYSYLFYVHLYDLGNYWSYYIWIDVLCYFERERSFFLNWRSYCVFHHLVGFYLFVILDSSFALQYLLCAFISIIYGLYLILELRLMIEQDVKIIIFLQEFKIVN